MFKQLCPPNLAFLIMANLLLSCGLNQAHGASDGQMLNGVHWIKRVAMIN